MVGERDTDCGMVGEREIVYWNGSLRCALFPVNNLSLADLPVIAGVIVGGALVLL